MQEKMCTLLRYFIFVSSCSFAMESPVYTVAYAAKDVEEKALFFAVAGEFEDLEDLLQRHVFHPTCMVKLVQNSLNNGLPYEQRMKFIIKLLEIGVLMDKPIGGNYWEKTLCLLGYVIRMHPQYIKPMILFGAPAHEFFAADVPEIRATNMSKERALLLKCGNSAKAFFRSQATGRPMQLLLERQRFIREVTDSDTSKGAL